MNSKLATLESTCNLIRTLWMNLQQVHIIVTGIGTEPRENLEDADIVLQCMAILMEMHAVAKGIPYQPLWLAYMKQSKLSHHK